MIDESGFESRSVHRLTMAMVLEASFLGLCNTWVTHCVINISDSLFGIFKYAFVEKKIC